MGFLDFCISGATHCPSDGRGAASQRGLGPEGTDASASFLWGTSLGTFLELLSINCPRAWKTWERLCNFCVSFLQPSR